MTNSNRVVCKTQSVRFFDPIVDINTAADVGYLDPVRLTDGFKDIVNVREEARVWAFARTLSYSTQIFYKFSHPLTDTSSDAGVAVEA